MRDQGLVLVRILIEGKKVQGIGYRIFLLEKALENGIEKIYARNVNKDKVELFVSDEEDKVNKFYEVIGKERPEYASVKKEPYENKIPIPTIDRYFQFLTLEQLSRGREEGIKLPEIVGKALDPIASALRGMDQKFDKVVDRFGLFAMYAKGMNSKLKGMDKKLDKIATLPEKLDALPEKIAKALSEGRKKSQD